MKVRERMLSKIHLKNKKKHIRYDRQTVIKLSEIVCGNNDNIFRICCMWIFGNSKFI